MFGTVRELIERESKNHKIIGVEIYSGNSFRWSGSGASNPECEFVCYYDETSEGKNYDECEVNAVETFSHNDYVKFMGEEPLFDFESEDEKILMLKINHDEAKHGKKRIDLVCYDRENKIEKTIKIDAYNTIEYAPRIERTMPEWNWDEEPDSERVMNYYYQEIYADGHQGEMSAWLEVHTLVKDNVEYYDYDKIID